MGKPLIIYGLANLLNHSFEVDVADPPANWVIDGSINPLQTSSVAFAHSAGIGIPSVQSHKQNVSTGAVGDKSVITQRVQVDDLISIVRDNDQEVAVVAMVKIVEPIASNNVNLDLLQYQGTNLVVAEGVLKTAPSTRTFITGDGPEWLMYITAQKLHADTNRLEASLRYEITDAAHYSVGADAYWDRVFIGGLVDFTKGIRDFNIRGEGGFSSNIGDGVAELVRLHKPMTQLDLTIRNIVEDTGLDKQLKSVMQMLASDTPPEFAIWADRDRFTNGSRHFQRVVLDAKTPRIDYPPGFPRRVYRIKGTAYSEFTD